MRSVGSIDLPLIGSSEQALFDIQDTRDRADRLREMVVPKLKVLLDHACDLLQEVYGTDALSTYRISMTPAHRRSAKNTLPFETSSAGLFVKGQTWYFQQRLECTSKSLYVTAFGYRGLEGNPIVRVLKGHLREVIRLLEHGDYEVYSEAIDSAIKTEDMGLAEFISELRLVPEREWARTSISGPSVDLPIQDPDSIRLVLYDFVALFPIFRAASHVLAGEDDRFDYYAKRFWSWQERLQERGVDDDPDTTARSTGPGPTPPVSSESIREHVEAALEGGFRVAIRRHRLRERRLRKQKIEEALRIGAGRLRCEVPGCNFDFLEVYGELGRDFAHVHHTNPLSDRAEPEMTKLSDLAIVCANCHAMIHRGRQCRPLESLILLRRDRQVNSSYSASASRPGTATESENPDS